MMIQRKFIAIIAACVCVALEPRAATTTQDSISIQSADIRFSSRDRRRDWFYCKAVVSAASSAERVERPDVYLYMLGKRKDESQYLFVYKWNWDRQTWYPKSSPNSRAATGVTIGTKAAKELVLDPKKSEMSDGWMYMEFTNDRRLDFVAARIEACTSAGLSAAKPIAIPTVSLTEARKVPADWYTGESKDVAKATY